MSFKGTPALYMSQANKDAYAKALPGSNLLDLIEVLPENTMSNVKVKRTRDEEMSVVRNLVETMVKAVVDDEEAVEVHTLVGEGSVMFEIIVKDSDMRYAMGQEGRTVEAMRRILNASCKKFQIKYAFNIISRDE